MASVSPSAMKKPAHPVLSAMGCQVGATGRASQPVALNTACRPAA